MECVHLLSPVPGLRVTILEEGLAQHFGERYLAEKCAEQWPPSGQANYDAACALVRELIGHDSEIIRKMRASEPIISRITAPLILRHCPSFDHDKAKTLAAVFA
jgi:hypothetical protein